jgi:hypothetical protein
MYEADDTEVVRASGRGSRIQAVRTYGEIAEILGKREGTSISALRVMRTCREAEKSVARALLGDPVLVGLFDTLST